MNSRAFAALLLMAWALLAAPAAQAQWRPTGTLAAVLVVDDCHETGGDVMVSRLEPATIYRCPRVVRRVQRQHPGAEHFFLVHEYGHIALQTADEAAADCWAARALAQAANGRRYLAAAIALFRARSDGGSRRYGSPAERADAIERCANEPVEPASRQ